MTQSTMNQYLQEWRKTFETNDLRLQHFDHGLCLLDNIGFPKRSDEDWRYLDIKPILQKTWFPSGLVDKSLITSKLQQIKERLRTETCSEHYSIVFVNGLLNLDLSTGLAEAQSRGLRVEVHSIDRANYHNDHGDNVTMTTSQLASTNGFIALNEVYFESKVDFTVAANSQLTKPIHCFFVTAGINDLMIHPRCQWTFSEGAKAKVIHHFLSVDNKCSEFINSKEIWRIDKNTDVHTVHLFDINPSSYIHGSSDFRIAERSKLHSTAMSLGGAMCRQNLQYDIIGNDAEIQMNGFYTVKGDEIVDFHTRVHHQIGGSKSQQLYEGILNDRGRAIFNGKVCIDKGAQEAESHQLNKNLLLSRFAEVDSKPEMDIQADNVIATHGATIGQLDPEELFYLQSRAISRDQAAEMIMIGFSGEVLWNPSSPDLAEYLMNKARGLYDFK